jgi:hypothetical protein
MASSSVTASSVTGWRAFLWGVALFIPLLVHAAELLPYPAPPAAPPTTAAVPEEVYQRFTNQVRSLTPEQRKQLADSLERSRATASSQGNTAGAQHYRRLLDILGTMS